MNELHKNQHTDSGRTAKEGRPRFLCSNKIGNGRPSLTSPRTFTEKEKQAFIELAKIFKRIHIRLIAEGYTIENGKITPPKHPNI